jgi:amino acid adenylation domain-containing protein
VLEPTRDVAATAEGVFEFGPGGAYLGYISDPSRARSAIGVIVFGLGRLESRVARRLAALGLVVMQIQVFRNFADLNPRLQFYDNSGVAACRQAIDEINSRRSITQVVLMGDCAECNISFNTALVDARVVGLILTNPNFDPLMAMLSFLDRLPVRLFSLQAWCGVLTGESKLVKSLLRRLGSQAADRWLAGRLAFRKDLVLPIDFDNKLSSLLTQRRVSSLIVYSKDGAGLRFFRRNYFRTLKDLAAHGYFTFKVMARDARADPKNDQAACQFADVVSDWAGTVLLQEPARRLETPSSPEIAAASDPSQHSSVIERFDAIAQLHPERVAVRDEARTLTYGQLGREYQRIAAAIVAIAADAGPVAVLLSHEARYPAAILGVLASGRACVPLDADHPAERNARIAAHSGAAIVLSTAQLLATARDLFAAGLPVIDLDRLGAGDCAAPEIVAAPAPHDVACVIYTSGSTGAPKGVFQNHRGLLQDAMEAVSFAGVSCNDRIALFYPPSVIAGLRTLLGGLLGGATMEVLPPRRFGRTALTAQVRLRAITQLRLSPTLFRHLADALPAGACFDDVRMVTLGGERVDWSDFDVFRRACPPHAQLAVHLGATECWTLHTEWKVDPAMRSSCPRLPVGRPIAGRRVDLVGEDGTVVAEGQVGEVVVTSRNIALGYWREPQLTAQSFAVDATDPLLRSYRTGDLVRRRHDGLVEFVGRKDNQIKLHGYRIEPDEVEAALKGCVGVTHAALLVRKNAAGTPTALAGYVQLQSGASLDHIRAALSERVPPYMMPAEIVVLDQLPWLPNFKIDRQQLGQTDAARLSQRAQTETSPLIGQLIEIFQHVTRVSGATPDDNILSLGGDSLQALELMIEIGRRFQVIVPEQAQDPTRTIAQWARDISAWRNLDATCCTE